MVGKRKQKPPLSQQGLLHLEASFVTPKETSSMLSSAGPLGLNYGYRGGNFHKKFDSQLPGLDTNNVQNLPEPMESELPTGQYYKELGVQPSNSHCRNTSELPFNFNKRKSEPSWSSSSTYSFPQSMSSHFIEKKDGIGQAVPSHSSNNKRQKSSASGQSVMDALCNFALARMNQPVEDSISEQSTDNLHSGDTAVSNILPSMSQTNIEFNSRTIHSSRMENSTCLANSMPSATINGQERSTSVSSGSGGQQNSSVAGITSKLHNVNSIPFINDAETIATNNSQKRVMFSESLICTDSTTDSNDKTASINSSTNIPHKLIIPTAPPPAVPPPASPLPPPLPLNNMEVPSSSKVTPKLVTTLLSEKTSILADIATDNIDEVILCSGNMLDHYWQFVQDNPYDFNGWTYLLQQVEKNSHLDAIRGVYNGFLPIYPYCYAYWKKYALTEQEAGYHERALQILDRGVTAIPLSVELWMAFIGIYRQYVGCVSDAVSKIRELFERAVRSAGYQYHSDDLWDSYIQWEIANGESNNIFYIFRRLIQIPTRLYNRHWDNFLQHIREYNTRDLLPHSEYLANRKECSALLGVPLEEEPALAPMLPMDKSISSETQLENAIKEKIVEYMQALHAKTEERVEKRWKLEEKIVRPYFHVIPLEKRQLKAWREYLDLEVLEAETTGDVSSVIMLYERCLIACAQYEEFWFSYARFLELQLESKETKSSVKTKSLVKCASKKPESKPDSASTNGIVCDSTQDATVADLAMNAVKVHNHPVSDHCKGGDAPNDVDVEGKTTSYADRKPIKSGTSDIEILVSDAPSICSNVSDTVDNSTSEIQGNHGSGALNSIEAGAKGNETAPAIMHSELQHLIKSAGHVTPSITETESSELPSERPGLAAARTHNLSPVEAIREVYKRACLVHCPSKPNIRLQWAMFEEQRGCLETARHLIAMVTDTYPAAVRPRLQLIGLERRQGRLDFCSELYHMATDAAPHTSLRTWWSMKHARFCFKILHKPDKALSVLRAALKKDKSNPRLFNHILDVCYQRNPVDIRGVGAVLMLALNNKELSIKDRLNYMRKRVEFYEEFGSIQQLRTAEDSLAAGEKQMQLEEKRIQKQQEDAAAAASQKRKRKASKVDTIASLKTDVKEKEPISSAATTSSPCVETCPNCGWDLRQGATIAAKTDQKSFLDQVPPTPELVMGVEPYDFGMDPQYKWFQQQGYKEYSALEEAGYPTNMLDPVDCISDDTKQVPTKRQKKGGASPVIVTKDGKTVPRYVINPSAPVVRNVSSVIQPSNPPGDRDHCAPQLARLPPELGSPDSPCVNTPSWFVSEGGELCLSDSDKGRSVLRYWPHFMTEKGFKRMMHTLRRCVRWQQKCQLSPDGQSVPVQRLVAWFGPCDYTRDGCTMKANDKWPPELLDLLERLASVTGNALNGCALSLFRSGRDCHPWHFEQHKALGPRPTIVLVSLGAIRTIEFRQRKGSQFLRFPLFPGSLLVMEGRLQADWLHQIPSNPRLKDDRISLEFRTMYEA